MKEIAETYLGETVTEAVVTVPAYFDDAQRQATKDAGQDRRARREAHHQRADGRRARLRPRQEGAPSASPSTTSAEARSISRSSRSRDGVFSVKATNGDTHLGGEDFDQRIVDSLADAFQKEHDVDLRKDRMALQRLKEAAEKAKHELSSSLETEINLPFIATNAKGEPLHVVKTMKRDELELLTRDLVERTHRALQEGARRRRSSRRPTSTTSSSSAA